MVHGGAKADSGGSQSDVERRLGFGRLLASALKARGMKQDDLAGQLGTTQSSVSGWINGRYEPSAATVFTMEVSLGLDPGSLSRPLGYLPVEPVSHPVSVEVAIAQSTRLGEDEKAAMSALYHVLARSSEGAPRPGGEPAGRGASRGRRRSGAGGL